MAGFICNRKQLKIVYTHIMCIHAYCTLYTYIHACIHPSIHTYIHCVYIHTYMHMTIHVCIIHKVHTLGRIILGTTKFPNKGDTPLVTITRAPLGCQSRELKHGARQPPEARQGNRTCRGSYYFCHHYAGALQALSSIM